MMGKKVLVVFLSSILLGLEHKTWSAPTHAESSSQSKELFGFVLPTNDDQAHQKIQMLSFDEEAYNLAYSVYLENQNATAAYQVAYSATQQRPEKKIWHERLAHLALWNQEPLVALEQYLNLITQFQEKSYILPGIKLARAMHEDTALTQFLRFDLQHGNNLVSNWYEYVQAMFRLGKIKELIEVLKANQDKLPPKTYLEYLSSIYKIESNPQKQQDVLQKLSQVIGIQPVLADELSEIYLAQGNIGLSTKIMMASNKTKTKNIAFWQAFAKIAYLEGNHANELFANKKLLEQKKPDESVYERIVELTAGENPNLAYTYALQGKYKYPQNYSLALDVYLFIVQTNHLNDLQKIQRTTSPALLKRLKFDMNYWDASAKYWQKMGNHEKAIETYLTAINYIGRDDELKANFLLFLLSRNETYKLSQVLGLWQSVLPFKPDLWSAYAQSFALLNQPMMTRLVLTLYYDNFKKYKNNPYWLIAFRDTLENSLFSKQATEMTRFTWPLYLKLLREQKTPPDYIQRIDYIKLSLYEAAGDPTAVALTQMQDYLNEEVEGLMFSWALQQNNFTLARAMYFFYKAQGLEPSGWVKLNIALNRNDRMMMRNVITDKNTVTARNLMFKENVSRDHVRAAQEIDALPRAQTIAFQELTRHRRDHELYDKFFTPLMLAGSNQFNISQEYYQYGSVAGPRTNLSYTYFLMPSIKLTPHNSIWFSNNLVGVAEPGSVDAINQELVNIPSFDERVGLDIKMKQIRGDLSLDLGYRKDLNGFPTARLTRTYPIYGRLNTTAVLGINQPANDTTSLYVGGMKNNIELDFDYQMAAKDTMSGSYTQNFYYTQDAKHLANGEQIVLEYAHKFRKSYPDWTLTPYGQLTQYYNKTRRALSGSILQLIPPDEAADINFLIPENSNEYGLTFSFGQDYIEEYSHGWRPFGLFTLSQNSVIGLGKLFNVGLAGSVFGRDHLLLYYGLGMNQGQGIQVERLAKLNYKIYL